MGDSLGKYRVMELLACMWSDDMSRRFPHADHSECLVEIRNLQVIVCRDWHCNRCGIHVNPLVRHGCLDRATPNDDTPPWMRRLEDPDL